MTNHDQVASRIHVPTGTTSRSAGRFAEMSPLVVGLGYEWATRADRQVH